LFCDFSENYYGKKDNLTKLALAEASGHKEDEFELDDDAEETKS